MPSLDRYLSGLGRRKPGPWARLAANPFVQSGDYLFALNEGGGTVSRAGSALFDQPGTFSHDGTYAGSGKPSWTTGVFGGPAVSFDGSGSYISYPTGFAAYTKTSAFSGVAWIKNDASGVGGWYTIISKYDGTNPGWALLVSGQSLQFALFDATATTGRWVKESTTSITSIWHQVGFSYDGSNTAAGISIYVDGKKRTPKTVTDADPGTLADAALYVGDDGAGNVFGGTIDHVVIVGRQWQAGHFARLYAEPFAFYRSRPPTRLFFNPPPPPVTPIAALAGRKKKARAKSFRRKKRSLWPRSLPILYAPRKKKRRAPGFRKKKRPLWPRPLGPIAVRKRKKRPAAAFRRKKRPLWPRPNAPLAIKRKRKKLAQAFRRKKRPLQTEGLLTHNLSVSFRRKTRRKVGRPYRHRGHPLPSPPKGGCPSLATIEAMQGRLLATEALLATCSVMESLQATGLLTERFTASLLAEEAGAATALLTEPFHSSALVSESLGATALLSERRSAVALVTEKLNATALVAERLSATALIEESLQGTARVVPCVKG